jgi:hypothetical protein
MWDEGRLLGVRPDVMVAQSAKETNYGHFTGTVPPHFNNFFGLKTGDGGDNDDPNAHAVFDFKSWGIRAGAEHLYVYAVGPLEEPIDPRHDKPVPGSAPNVEDLGGRWAVSATYGTSIVRRLNLMIETEVPLPDPPLLTEEEVRVLKSLAQFILEASQ